MISLSVSLCVLVSLAFMPSVAMSQSSCGFVSGAPIVEYEIPSLLHTLKFVNVQAKVYRTVMGNTGGVPSQPKLKIMQYSSSPVIFIDDVTKEIQISTEDTNCLKQDPKDDTTPDETDSHGIKLQSSSVVSTVATASTIFLFGANVFGTAKAAILSAVFLSLVNNKSSGKNSIFVSADDSPCTQVMEVVLEAPPYYRGSVAECNAEVEDVDHCPIDFPTYSSCSADPSPSCSLAIIGGGTGGLYTASRLVEEGIYDGSEVCVFEATERVGGRLYSLRGFGPDNTITVDAGGYRSWPEFTPTTHALIERLGLNVGCYEDESKLDGPCEKFNIVDETGEKIGFATFVETMMSNLIDQGACLYFRHELTSISHDITSGKNTLHFANGVMSSEVEQTILNVPQRPLLEILRKSDIPFTGGINEEIDIYDALHAVQTEVVTKLYLYYEDAWWLKLGLYNGNFEYAGDARNMLLKGRYHDGHTQCSDDKCYGFLLAVYAHDFGGTKSQFFRRYQRDRPEPVTVISNTDTEGTEFLNHAHARMKEFHLYNNPGAPYTGFEATGVFDSSSPPTFAVLATWNIATYGAGGGWHHWTDTSDVIIEKAMKPLNDYNIHLVNEAYSKLQGWAEGTLMLADEVLEEQFGVSRPWSFDAPDFVQYVAQTSSEECVAEDDDSGGGSGGGGSGGDGGGSAGDDSVLCFTKDAMVTMADGSLKFINLVKEGDYVSTGFRGGRGLVTKSLVHPVGASDTDRVQVAVIPTPEYDKGELVGTPDHPIYFCSGPHDQECRWVEIQEAMLMNDFSHVMAEINNTALEFRFVDMFYNLEIDGDKPGSSTHSYVVNGVIASGLGDDLVLNSLYPRQNHWKKETF